MEQHFDQEPLQHFKAEHDDLQKVLRGVETALDMLEQSSRSAGRHLAGLLRHLGRMLEEQLLPHLEREQWHLSSSAGRLRWDLPYLSAAACEQHTTRLLDRALGMAAQAEESGDRQLLQASLLTSRELISYLRQQMHAEESYLYPLAMKIASIESRPRQNECEFVAELTAA